MSEHTTDNVLVQKIAADTQSRVDEVHAQAQAEVADIERETHKQLELLQAEAKTQLKKKEQQMELVGVSKARQAANIALQTAKRTAVDTSFASAFTDIAQLPADQYIAFFTKHVEAVVPKGSEVVAVSAPESRQDETQTILQTALGSALDVAKAQSKAGLIVHTTDGVFDVTLERIMGEKRAALEIEIVKEVMS